jgi:hypothetical protein
MGDLGSAGERGEVPAWPVTVSSTDTRNLAALAKQLNLTREDFARCVEETREVVEDPGEYKMWRRSFADALRRTGLSDGNAKAITVKEFRC